MPDPQSPPANLVHQLAKLFPPEVIDRLNQLSPEARAQLEEAVPALSRLKVTRANDYKATYSNIFRIRIGPSEMTVLFARQSHSPSIVAMADTVEEEVEVTMGWPQIKMLQIALTDIVSSYEEEIDAIHIPVAFKPNAAGWRQAVRNLGLRPIAPTSGDAPVATANAPASRRRPQPKG
jgi:hypothetical protein